MTDVIRPRTAEDLPACVEVMRAVYATSGYPVQGTENALEDLQTTTAAWVAVVDGVVVGHVAMSEARDDYASVVVWRQRKQQQQQEQQQHPNEDNKGDDDKLAILGWLYVHPDARKRGLATKLINAVQEEARRRGGLRLVMFALVKDQGAIRLYRSLGWVHYGNTVFRWGEGNEMAAECFASPLDQ